MAARCRRGGAAIRAGAAVPEISAGRRGVSAADAAVEAIQKATEAGTGFVFGYLGGGELPFAETKPGAAFIFAFRALPMVLVVSALATLLFYWGVLQRIVQAFAWVLRRIGRGRRAARARRGGAYLCRAYRGAAADPALSGEAASAANCSR